VKFGVRFAGVVRTGPDEFRERNYIAFAPGRTAANLLRLAFRLALRLAFLLSRAGGLFRPQAPAREFLEAGDERLAAGRAAGAGAGADRLDQGGVLARAKPLHPPVPVTHTLSPVPGPRPPVPAAVFHSALCTPHSALIPVPGSRRFIPRHAAGLFPRRAGVPYPHAA